MKLLMLVFVFTSLQVYAQTPITQCIADRLQAYNSDIYCDLSSDEVTAMLNNPELMGHYDALREKKACEEELQQAQAYQCVADRLQAYNSDIYYDMTPAEINSILRDPSSMGYHDVVRTAQDCGLQF